MKKTILVVDDQKDIRNAFKKTLELEGYKVITASSGKDCLSKLKKKKVDLVLLDILMPKMTGVTTLRKIKELYPAMKVVMVTVVETEETQGKTITLGVEGYLIKPVSKQNLTQAVIDILESEV